MCALLLHLKGGMVLLSEAVFKLTSPLAMRDECVIINVGKHLMPMGDPCGTAVYQVISKL